MQEIREEQSGSNSDITILLNADLIERALMSRLSDPPASYPQWPVQYLLGSYARAVREIQSLEMNTKDPAEKSKLSDTLALCRKLSVSFVGFALFFEMFPQPEPAEKRGFLQLLDSMYIAEGSGQSNDALLGPSDSWATPPIPSSISEATAIVPMPGNFMEEFAAQFEDEGFSEKCLSVLIASLNARLSKMSLFGDWMPSLNVLMKLIRCGSIAEALVQMPNWLSRPGSDGRAVEFQTILGPIFGISSIPDIAVNPLSKPQRQPDPVEQIVSNPEAVNVRDVHSASMVVGSLLGQLHDCLHQLIMTLLRNPAAKQATIDWIAAALHCNAERAKMRPDVRKAATEGFMINLSAVCLRLCRPFLDPVQGKAWPRLDPRYPSDPQARGRSFNDDTRLGATHDEVGKWISDVGSSPSYHFICESFFLCALSLRLGMCKATESLQNVARSAQHYAEDARSAQAAARSGNAMAASQGQMMEGISKRLKGITIAFDVTLRRDDVLTDALGYYRLMAAWLLRLACPSAAEGKAPSLPLPLPALMEFSSLPEYFVEDMCTLLVFVARTQRNLATAPIMEQFMLFFTMFLGSPAYIKNPYLRGRMVEALHCYMPENEADISAGFAARRRGWIGADEVATLFEVHPLVIQAMVQACISLYVDIERTDRHNAFYEKFNTRYQIGEILAYLWELPQHRATWRQVAASEPRLYVRFINMMINDSQHLLQEALETLPVVQETEKLMGDPTRWSALEESERQERESAQRQNRRILRNDFALSQIYLDTMKFTSADAEVASRFFDVQVRDRQARILNFFLRYLTLPSERVRLRLRNPDEYGWRPKELLTLLASIHVNLYRANRESWAAAVAADTDYYGKNPEIFSELVNVLRPHGLAPEPDIAELEALAAAAANVAAGTMEEDEAFEDVPEEFEDPVRCSIMNDPVRLPSGAVLDRATILQHLLTDNRDPFSRAPMTEDDLEELPELKERIEAWVKEQREKKKANAGGS